MRSFNSLSLVCNPLLGGFHEEETVAGRQISMKKAAKWVTLLCSWRHTNAQFGMRSFNSLHLSPAASLRAFREQRRNLFWLQDDVTTSGSEVKKKNDKQKSKRSKFAVFCFILVEFCYNFHQLSPAAFLRVQCARSEGIYFDRKMAWQHPVLTWTMFGKGKWKWQAFLEQ